MIWLRTFFIAGSVLTLSSHLSLTAADNQWVDEPLSALYDDYNGSTTIFNFPPFEADGVIFDARQDAIYVSGFTGESFDSQQSHGLLDGYITRFSASGERKWTRMIGGKNIDTLFSIAFDPLESAIYACGYTLGNVDGVKNAGQNGKTSDIMLVKHTDDGRQLWLRLYGSPQDEGCEALAVDPQRKAVYLAGVAFGPLDGQSYRGEGDALVMRISTVDGSPVWTRLFGTTNADQLNAISIGGDADEIFVGGIVGGSLENQPFQGGFFDGIICRFDADGKRIQTMLLGTARNDWIQAVEYSSSNKVLYVGGSTDGSFSSDQPSERGQFDAFAAKLSAQLTSVKASVQWLTQYGGFGFDVVTNIVYQPSTNATYLIGSSTFTVDRSGLSATFMDKNSLFKSSSAPLKKTDYQKSAVKSVKRGKKSVSKLHGKLKRKHRKTLSHGEKAKQLISKIRTNMAKLNVGSQSSKYQMLRKQQPAVKNRRIKSRLQRRNSMSSVGDKNDKFDMFLSKIIDNNGKYVRTQMFGTSGEDFGMDLCMDTRRDALLLVGRFDNEAALLRVNTRKLFGSSGSDNPVVIQPPPPVTDLPQPSSVAPPPASSSTLDIPSPTIAIGNGNNENRFHMTGWTVLIIVLMTCVLVGLSVLAKHCESSRGKYSSLIGSEEGAIQLE